MRPRRSLLACCLYLLVAGGAARAETVALTTGQDDPPFTDSSRPDGGLVTHLVLEIFRSMGVQTRLDWLPWRRGYSLTKSGVYQASFPYLRTEERERDFLFSDPIFSDFSYLWTRSGDAIGTGDPSRFKNRIICVPQGYHSPLLDLLKTLIASGEVKLERPDAPEKCVQMLAAGRVDALSGEEATITTAMRTQGLAGRIVHDPTPLAKLDFHVVFPRGGTGAGELQTRFNAALRRMKEDGRYAALIAW